jgi:hypothetical protein
MGNLDGVAKGLAIAGTIFVWLPILVPVFLCIVILIVDGEFLFDFIMPAELFPAVIVGGVLLGFASSLARSRQIMIGLCIAVAIFSLIMCVVFAQVSGLASGDNPAEGLRLVIVAIPLVIYILAVIALGIGGVLLMRDLFNPSRRPKESPLFDDIKEMME